MVRIVITIEVDGKDVEVCVNSGRASGTDRHAYPSLRQKIARHLLAVGSATLTEIANELDLDQAQVSSELRRGLGKVYAFTLNEDSSGEYFLARTPGVERIKDYLSGL